uniref:Uncharacterized protein n=1 Tax=Oryza meridionalis TaxID=40149 RepID=A0A0E0CCI1_9ORYZ
MAPNAPKYSSAQCHHEVLIAEESALLDYEILILDDINYVMASPAITDNYLCESKISITTQGDLSLS